MLIHSKESDQNQNQKGGYSNIENSRYIKVYSKSQKGLQELCVSKTKFALVLVARDILAFQPSKA